MHLPAPKNFCKRDIELSKDTPVFATADAPMVLIKGGGIDRANTEMMNVRWRFFIISGGKFPQLNKGSSFPVVHALLHLS